MIRWNVLTLPFSLGVCSTSEAPSHLNKLWKKKSAKKGKIKERREKVWFRDGRGDGRDEGKDGRMEGGKEGWVFITRTRNVSSDGFRDRRGDGRDEEKDGRREEGKKGRRGLLI
jgi:hypothetical protein